MTVLPRASGSNGDGTFNTPVFQNLTGDTTPFTAAATVAADYNQDGKLDLVATTHVASSTGTITYINIFFGNGDGTFNCPEISIQEPTDGSSTGWLGVGDFDGDGNMDIAYLLFSNCELGSNNCQSSVHVLYGENSGTLNAQYIGDGMHQGQRQDGQQDASQQPQDDALRGPFDAERFVL